MATNLDKDELPASQYVWGEREMCLPYNYENSLQNTRVADKDLDRAWDCWQDISQEL